MRHAQEDHSHRKTSPSSHAREGLLWSSPHCRLGACSVLRVPHTSLALRSNIQPHLQWGTRQAPDPHTDIHCTFLCNAVLDTCTSCFERGSVGHMGPEFPDTFVPLQPLSSYRSDFSPDIGINDLLFWPMPLTLSVHTASFFPRNVRSDYLPGVQLDPLSLRKSRRSNTLFRMSRMSSKSMYRRLSCASHASSFADKCLGWPCSYHGCLLVPEELPSERPFQPERARTSDCLAPTNTLELCPRHNFSF